MIQIQTQNRSFEIREKLIKYYKQFLNSVVYIKKHDGVVCKGLFKEFSPDGKLLIVGSYKRSLVDPLDIREFTETKKQLERDIHAE